MVHAIAIAAAATAGVSVAVAFELAVFKPWRDENWPHGVAEGVRAELQKLRDEFGMAVSEIHEDLRSLRADRRRGERCRSERLRDDELDDFRQGIGEERSTESQWGFEMHEREAEAYRDRLRASFTSQLQQTNPEVNLRRRHGHSTELDALDRSMGDLPSSATGCTPSPPSCQVSVGLGQTHSADSATDDLAGLDFASAPPSAALVSRSPPAGHFASLEESTTSSWTAPHDESNDSPNNYSVTHSDNDVQSRDSQPSGFVVMSNGLNSETHDLPFHMGLETNGLSQTLSSQQQSVHNIHSESRHDSAGSSCSPAASALASERDYDANHEDSDELAFEMLSIGDSENSSDLWSQLHSPCSPPPFEGSHPTEIHRDRPAVEHVHSDSGSDESWANVGGSEL